MTEQEQTVYMVFGNHNRHGEWLAGAYSNAEAAQQHKAYLDATQDGWENFTGGRVEHVAVLDSFSTENDDD